MGDPTNDAAHLRKLLALTRDHWLALQSAKLGVYALPLTATPEELPGLKRARDHLWEHGPCGNGPLERAIAEALGERSQPAPQATDNPHPDDVCP